MLDLLTIFIAKLIFNFNFKLEDEIALFLFSPATHPDQKSSFKTQAKLQLQLSWKLNLTLVT